MRKHPADYVAEARFASHGKIDEGVAHELIQEEGLNETERQDEVKRVTEQGAPAMTQVVERGVQLFAEGAFAIEVDFRCGGFHMRVQEV